jgi:hypothetical protein
MKQTFPIGFWNYNPIETVSIKDVADWADCGMAVTLSPVYDSRRHNAKLVRDILDESQRQGLKIILSDQRLLGWDAPKNAEAYRKIFEDAYRDYGQHPAVYGFSIGDEPQNPDECIAAATAIKVQQETAPHLVPFLNFGPWPGFEDDVLRGKNMVEWGTDFTAQSGCKMLCYDCYSQMRPEEEGIDHYFANLHKYGSIARAANIPFWTTLLSTGHYRYRCPSQDDMRWQLSSAAASGAREYSGSGIPKAVKNGKWNGKQKRQ